MPIKNVQQYIVIRKNKIVFIGAATDVADFVRIKSVEHIYQYAKRLHSYKGYYFVKLPDGIKNKKEDEIHSSIASASSVRAHLRIAMSRLESAIADSDSEAVDMIDRYLRIMLKNDRMREFMEQRGYKIHEYD